MSASTRTLVLSDFDGTITKVDTLFHFILFVKGKVKFAAGMLLLLPVLLIFVMRLLPSGKAKAIICSFFFKDCKKTDLERAGVAFCDHLISHEKLRQSVLGEIMELSKQGATVAVVSASADTWVQAFCAHYGFICICTRFHYHEGKFTGHFSGANCQGVEKKNRVLQQFPGLPYDDIIVFGNSFGDEAMMELATRKVWVK